MTRRVHQPLPLPTTHTSPAAAVMNSNGARVASGIGAIARATPLNALFAEHVTRACDSPCVFLDTMRPIEKAGYIPGVMGAARYTYDAAEDAKSFGELRGDPLSVDEMAFLMKYSSEDSVPPLYADMNDKAYDKDRRKVAPYGQRAGSESAARGCG